MNLEQFPGVNAGYVLELYERYRQDPESVDLETRRVFESWTPSIDAPAGGAANEAPLDTRVIDGAANLVESIRRYGHLAAHLDPLGSAPIGDPSLSPRAHGITDDDLKSLPASLVGGPVAESSSNAFDAIEKLRRVYCSTTGFDYAHVFVPEEREWLRSRAASCRRWTRRAPRRCSTASRRSRCSSGSCTAPFRARRGFRSKGSTCWCRSSTRSSVAPRRTAPGTP